MTTTPEAAHAALMDNLNHSLDRLETLVAGMEDHPCRCVVGLARPHFANVREIVDRLDRRPPVSTTPEELSSAATAT